MRPNKTASSGNKYFAHIKKLRYKGADFFRACLNFVVEIYYEVIFERTKANFATIVGHYGEKLNEGAAKKNHKKANEYILNRLLLL